MKALVILLTIMGGFEIVAESGSNGSEGTISGRDVRVEAVKSQFDSKPQLHYRPGDGTFGGPMPFFWKGEYHLFYLGQEGVRRHIVSENLVNWKELPVALPLGAPGEPDSSHCAAGSIIERNGTFHFFYLGRSRKDGKTSASICHSTSQDLIHWSKDPRNPILTADHEKYIGLTKDPFVFWNEQDQRYWMLIADRLRKAPTARKGALALAVSPDLEQWDRRQEPFWAPDNSTCEFEVPELFLWNKRWYLTYGTYIETTRSHYRVANQVTGPWLAPTIDTFDDHSYNSVKTVSDGKRRLVFGSIPTGWKPARADGTEEVPGDAQQALGIREVTQRPDGSLAFQCPPEILRSCGPTIPAELQGKLGTWSGQVRGFRANRVDGLAYAVAEDLPANLLVEMVITLKPNTRSAGIMFRTTPDLARGYMVRLEPNLGRVVFDHWPKGWPRVRGEHPFSVQRPLHPRHFSWEKPIAIQLLIDGTIAEVFVDNQVALVTRVYDHKDGDIALYVEHGEAEFEDITFKSLP